MLRGEGGEGAVGVRVELDEDEVPDFDALGGALVDQEPAGVAGGREVNVQLGAWAAGAGLAHHPEVVLFVAIHDVDGGVEAFGAEFFGPEVPCLLVALGGVADGFVGIVNGRIDALRGEAPALDDQLPRPLDGFLFEIVAEGPVPEHLEEGVVIRVEADVIEVVVLAARADALLGVRRARVAAGDCAAPFRDVRAFLAEEDGDELVHAGVREEEVWRVRHERAARHDGVLFLAEEIEERLADLGAGEHGVGAAVFGGRVEKGAQATWRGGKVKAGVSVSAALARLELRRARRTQRQRHWGRVPDFPIRVLRALCSEIQTEPLP